VDKDKKSFIISVRKPLHSQQRPLCRDLGFLLETNIFYHKKTFLLELNSPFWIVIVVGRNENEHSDTQNNNIQRNYK
jgi:hypothetical protein